MHEVVAYKRLKTMESYKTVSSKSELSDLWGALFYERFQLLAFTGKMFYKLRDSQSYMGGWFLWEVVAHGGLTLFFFTLL